MANEQKGFLKVEQVESLKSIGGRPDQVTEVIEQWLFGKNEEIMVQFFHNGAVSFVDDPVLSTALLGGIADALRNK